MAKVSNLPPLDVGPKDAQRAEWGDQNAYGFGTNARLQRWGLAGA